jgi:hypothetical protein
LPGSPNDGKSIMSSLERDDAKLAALDQRVLGLERGVHDLSTQLTSRFAEVGTAIAGLTAKLDERSKTPWATIVSAMGVVLAIVVAGGQLAKAPLDTAISRLERDTMSLSTNTVPLSSFGDFKGAYENNRVLARQELDARFARVDSQIARVEEHTRSVATDIVPRGEHEERWRSEDRDIQSMQRQVDELKTAFGGIYGARDVIIDLRGRLDRVERARSGS